MNLDEAMDEATNEDQEGSESSSDLEILDDVEVVPDTEADDTFQEKAIQEGVSQKSFFTFFNFQLSYSSSRRHFFPFPFSGIDISQKISNYALSHRNCPSKFL